MARPKGDKEWLITSYSLDKETRDRIREVAKYENMTQGDLISFLIHNWDQDIDPSHKLNKLIREREKIAEEMKIVDIKIQEVTKEIEYYNEWKNKKITRKSKAKNILKSRILRKEFAEAETIAKTWQRITGVPAVELLAESTEEIDRSGI